MEIRSATWASNNHLVLTLRQKVRDKIEGQNQGVYESRIAILDLDDKSFEDFDAASPAVENLLPAKPGKIIISEQQGMEEDLNIREAFRPRAYYEMDLETGNKQLLIRGKIDLGQIGFDEQGNPRHARGYDAKTVITSYSIHYTKLYESQSTPSPCQRPQSSSLMR